ncbi:hypothetical protein GCM10019016_044040 [Streptomyces prasinosporus]|uniref:ABC transmembrane type-1 domain-containing protein n=1 Tax=Streptomyces prasinosporus TaxID=68256 RepID=A0ABP6TRI3_9ACTN
MSTVAIKTEAAEPVGATIENATAAIGAAKVVGTGKDLALELDYTPSAEGAYPIVLVTYEIVCDKGNKAETLPATKSFLNYMASEDGQGQPRRGRLRPDARGDHHQGPRDHLGPQLTRVCGPAPRPRGRVRTVRCTAIRSPSAPGRLRPSRPDPAAPQTGESDGHPYAEPHRPSRTRPTDRGREQRAARGATRPGDRIFLGLSRGSGIFVLVIMAAIAAFLTYRASIAISKNEANFFTAFEWNPSGVPAGVRHRGPGLRHRRVVGHRHGHRGPDRGRHRPVHHALRPAPPRRPHRVRGRPARRRPVHRLRPVGRPRPRAAPGRASTAGWTSTSAGPASSSGTTARPRSLFTVGILLAIMILPIITNVSREVFRQVPRMHEEAALALGATRWEVIRMSVLPFGRSGVISASMLGLGRALGETMAVAMVLSSSFDINASLLDTGGGTFAQNIASKFNEATEMGRDALIASGLVLFVITLLVNGAARLIIARRKEYSGANA